MFKLFKRSNKIDVELTGEYTVSNPSIESYEEYCKKKAEEQLYKEVYNFLEGIVGSSHNSYNSSYMYGRIDALKHLANYLVKNANHSS